MDKCNILEFLNKNEGAMSAILAVLSLGVAVIAIIISLQSSNKQQKVDLFNERYLVYNKFAELYNKMDMLLFSSLTSKGRLIFWNMNIYDSNPESTELGKKIVAYSELMADGSLEKKGKITKQREECAYDKCFLDYSIAKNDALFLKKSKFLFENDIYNEIEVFASCFLDLVMVMNINSESDINEAFDNMSKQCNIIKEKKILEKMEKKISLKR